MKTVAHIISHHPHRGLIEDALGVVALFAGLFAGLHLAF